MSAEGGLILTPVEVHSPEGETRKALLACCPNCDGRTWVVFQLEGTHHLHLQCMGCDTSYCPQGTCDIELT